MKRGIVFVLLFVILSYFVVGLVIGGEGDYSLVVWDEGWGEE